MDVTKKIGIVGGAGWMGSAMVRYAVENRKAPPESFLLSSRVKPAADIPGVQWTSDNSALIEWSDIVVLSVRPDQFDAVALPVGDKPVVSVMAVISADRIAETTGARQIIRSMPNAAAVIGASFTPWYATASVTQETKRAAQLFFETFGEAAEVSTESQLDFCIGMTGSGAAYPALLIQALTDHAVAKGLPQPFAERAATYLVASSSRMLLRPDTPARKVVADMIAYRGIIAAGLEGMLAAGFTESVAAGLDAALSRNRDFEV